MGVDEYVRRLEVPVNDSLAVDMMDTDELIGWSEHTIADHRNRKNTHKFRNITARVVNWETLLRIGVNQVMKITPWVERLQESL